MPPLDCITKTRERFGARPLRSHSPFQALQITLHERLQVCIDHHRAGALVLAEFRQNLVRERQRQSQFLQHAADRALVVGIGKREQRRDRDRFRATGMDIARQHPELLPGGPCSTSPSQLTRSGTPKPHSRSTSGGMR